MPCWSHLARIHTSAEVLPFLIVQGPPVVTFGGVHNVQVSPHAQRFLCREAGKQRVCGYLLLALGAEGTKRRNEMPRQGRRLYAECSLLARASRSAVPIPCLIPCAPSRDRQLGHGNFRLRSCGKLAVGSLFDGPEVKHYGNTARGLNFYILHSRLVIPGRM